MRGIYPQIQTATGLAERDPSPVSPLSRRATLSHKGRGKKT